jgi:hypothetical protein
MQRNCFRIAAIVEELVEVTEDLLSAIHLYGDAVEDTEATRTMATAWLNSLKALRDLVRGAIARHQNG